MQSSAKTVDEYIASLPEDRRAAVEAVRRVILKNLDKDYEEGMQYGMIGYSVPHRVYPAGYHCDPKQPLPFAGLASQKGHMSLYLMGLYCGCGFAGDDITEDSKWFRSAWTKAGKKLDMGKACVRFRKLEDVPLDVVGEAIRRIPPKVYIDRYEAELAKIGTPVAKAGGRARADAAAKGVPAKKNANVAKKKAVKRTKGGSVKAGTSAKVAKRIRR